MKVKRIDLLNLWHALETLKGRTVGNIKFSYFVAKNRLKIKDEIDAINEVQEPPETFKAFDQKRSSLAESYADKDKDKKPVVRNNQYVITKNREKFDEELENLKKTFKKVVKEREEQLEKFKEFLQEEIEFDGHKIKLNYLPSDIEPLYLEALMIVDLIIED